MNNDNNELEKMKREAISPIIAYLKQQRITKTTEAVCYSCHQRLKKQQLHFIQLPSLIRLADEPIETRPICTDCNNKKTKKQ